MPTLEEEKIIHKQHHSGPLRKETVHHRISPQLSSTKLLSELFIGFVFLGLSFFFSSFVYLQNSNARFLADSMSQFRWIVLVKNDQLVVDEVGRYIKQMEDVRDVKFIPSTDIEKKITQEKIMEEMPDEIVNGIPPAWEITWNENIFDSVRIQNIVTDLKNLPGVIDVAYNREVEPFIQFQKVQRAIYKAINESLYFGFVLLILAGGFPFLFIKKIKKPRWGEVSRNLVAPVVGWFGGFLLAWLLFGSLPISLLLGSFIGLGRLFFTL